MTSTVVILLSDKRSGSTMLETELCRHPDVQHVAFTPHTYNETHYWVKAACMLPTRGETFSGGKRPDSYGSTAATRQSLVKTVLGNVPGFLTPDDDRQLIFEGWEALCKQFALPVFFEKTPHHAHHWAALQLLLTWIGDTDYSVRVICLVRNPMAVMHSALQLFYTDPQERQFGWVSAYRNIFKFQQLLKSEQFKLVKYEDLVKNPEKNFREVCKFIGIDYQSQIGSTVNSNSLSKWCDDPGFDFQLDGSVADFAKSLGYKSDELISPTRAKTGFLSGFQRKVFLMFKRMQNRIYNKAKRLGN